MGLLPGLGSRVSFVRSVGPVVNGFLDYFINELGEAHLFFFSLVSITDIETHGFLQIVNV